jgi:hypothetical protein
MAIIEYNRKNTKSNDVMHILEDRET